MNKRQLQQNEKTHLKRSSKPIFKKIIKMKINQIIDKIDGYQLFVPAFQREFVWKRDDAKKLISSMLHDYPTGTMLTWETNSPPELKGKYTYDHNKGSVKLILDGQQRITTLYLLIKGE